MAEWIEVSAADGHRLSAYVARPHGQPRGGLVVAQEIFGVNEHVRDVADGYAEAGYFAIAPALFDRIEPGIQLTYSAEDMQKAFALYGRLKPDTALLDVAAAFAQADVAGKGAGVLGFCFGGLIAWLSATRGPGLGFQPRCAVGYYAGGIGNFAAEQPSCPVMLHFGAEDSHIGPDQVEAVRAAHPEVSIFVYPGAGHAFNRDRDPKSFHAQAAALAKERTLAFLERHFDEVLTEARP